MPPTVALAPVQPTDGDGPRRRGIIAHWRRGAAYELSRPGSPRRWVSVSHSALHIRSRQSAFHPLRKFNVDTTLSQTWVRGIRTLPLGESGANVGTFTRLRLLGGSLPVALGPIIGRTLNPTGAPTSSTRKSAPSTRDAEEFGM
jgi:hypothetical protein